MRGVVLCLGFMLTLIGPAFGCDRHSVVECTVHAEGGGHYQSRRKRSHNTNKGQQREVRRNRTVRALQDTQHEVRLMPHPAGCPATLFCGCGVSVRVFGRSVRELWLAANWGRFPSAVAAAGMVAWRRGHVFFIERVLGDGMVLAFDPNSGGHKTRLWPRSLAGYRVVDPRG